MTSEWRTVPGYPRYEVSRAGQVRNAVRGNVLKPFSRGRYPCVKVINASGSTCRLVHRLVLEAFCGDAPPMHVGAHLDGDRFNARLENLRWVTAKENESHKIAHGRTNRGHRSTQAKFTDDEAGAIRKAHAAGMSLAQIAAGTGASRNTIHRIVRGERYKG